MATKMPVASCSRVSPVRVSVKVTPVTLLSPWILVMAEFQAKLILGGLSLARWAMIREARSSSLRTTTVTVLAKRVRNVASSMAESPAADDDDVLFTEEESVAGGAPGHSVAAEFLLFRQTEFLVGRAGGEDDRRCLVRLASAGDHALEMTLQVHLGDVVEHDPRANLSACSWSPSMSSGPWIPPGEAGGSSPLRWCSSAPPRRR